MNDPNTSQKSYWKIINRVMNKCRAPKIPPLLVNNVFILNCCEKAKPFNDFFSKQCKPSNNASVLPPLNFLSAKRIDQISIHSDEIISLIRHLNWGGGGGGTLILMIFRCPRVHKLLLDYNDVYGRNGLGWVLSKLLALPYGSLIH